MSTGRENDAMREVLDEFARFIKANRDTIERAVAIFDAFTAHHIEIWEAELEQPEEA